MSVTIKGLWRKGNYYYYRKMVGGQRTVYALGAVSENEALSAILRLQRQPAVIAPASWEHEVRAYVDNRIARRRLSRTFIHGRLSILLRFAQDYAINHPQEVSTALVQRYYHDLKKRVKDNTAVSYIFTLRSFFGHLVEAKKLAHNPARGVALDRIVAHYNHRFAEKDLVTRLIKNCRRPDLRFVLLCGFDAGLRRLEIDQAPAEWFRSNGVVHVHNSSTYETKDGDDRLIPLTKRFQAFLKTFGRHSPFMLHPEEPAGLWKYRWDFRRPFGEYMEAQGHGWITPQTMRHSFASNRIAGGVDIYKVAKWLGDGVDVVQRHYGHLAPRRDKDIEKGV